MRLCRWEEVTEGQEVGRPLSKSIQAEPFVKRRNQVTANENEFEVFIKRQGVSLPFSKEGTVGHGTGSWARSQEATEAMTSLGAIYAKDCCKNFA